MGEKSVFDYARIAARAEERLLKLMERPGSTTVDCSDSNRPKRGQGPRGSSKCSG